MGVKTTAEKNILRKKLQAENIADGNLTKVLQDDTVKMLFVKCKQLIVEIARLEVNGEDASEKRNEYNETRDMIAQVLSDMKIDKESLKPNYSCKKCKDTGYIGAEWCECLKKEISSELIKISGIDINNFARFDNKYDIFDNPKEAKAIYTKMKKYIDEINNTDIDVVLIMGNTGVGKTHLIECMTTHALEKGIALKYSTAFSFNQDMLRYHCARLEEKEDVIDPYITSEILFIDDLGTENKINNVTNEYLYLVINERMQNNKKTVITTNLNLEQIQDVYGERIFSRLMHKKQSVKFIFPGSDLRLKK